METLIRHHRLLRLSPGASALTAPSPDLLRPARLAVQDEGTFSLRKQSSKQPMLCPALVGSRPLSNHCFPASLFMILHRAGMSWDLEAMPAQETCEPAKYGGAVCRCHPTELPSVLPHTCFLHGMVAGLHTVCCGIRMICACVCATTG